MKKITVLLFLITYFGFFNYLKSQCISGDCTNGNGVYLFEDKSRYEGDFKNEEANGKGKLYFSSGAIYEGSFQAGVINGFGKYKYSSKDIYEGYFKNEEPDGQGKLITSDGDIYEGQFKGGQLNGTGSILLTNGDKYTGSLVDNIPDGNGIYYYVSGDRFEGTYKKGVKNGSGTLQYSKGGTLKGIWVDGVYVSGSSKVKTDSTVIQLIPTPGGVYEVPILINSVLKIDFIFDTGASEVFLTPDVILTLIRTKTINDADILEGKSFVDANGNVNESLRFNLKEIKLGNYTLHNIPCGVSETIQGLSLLGLSALKELGKIEINFNESTIKVIR